LTCLCAEWCRAYEAKPAVPGRSHTEFCWWFMWRKHSFMVFYYIIIIYFEELYVQCKQGYVNQFLQIQLKWHQHSAAFLLSRSYSLITINLKESSKQSVSAIRMQYLDYCNQAFSNIRQQSDDNIVISCVWGVVITSWKLSREIKCFWWHIFGLCPCFKWPWWWWCIL